LIFYFEECQEAANQSSVNKDAEARVIGYRKRRNEKWISRIA
jgi:hypothetical protein